MPGMRSLLSAVGFLGHDVNIYCGESRRSPWMEERYGNHRQPVRTDRPKITCVM